MKIAILSDIHANLEAFNEVLADIAKSNVDSSICLGDMIGYGPDPEAVVTKIRSLEIPTIMGNHELAIVDPRYLEWFNPLARESIQKTVPMLSRSRAAEVWMGCWLRFEGRRGVPDPPASHRV